MRSRHDRSPDRNHVNRNVAAMDPLEMEEVRANLPKEEVIRMLMDANKHIVGRRDNRGKSRIGL